MPRGAAASAEELAEFERLVREHEPQIYRVAYRMTGNYDDAQDLVQDVVLEAFQYFHSFEPGTRFDRWVFRIMSNTYIDQVRRRRRIMMQPLEEVWDTEEGEGLGREIADTAPDPEEQLMHRELEEPLQRALDALPQEFRSVVILSDMEGMTYEEIAQTLRCPIGTVRSRLNRGRNQLRRLLGPQLRQLFGAGERKILGAERS